MTFVEKIEKSLDTFKLNDTGDSFMVWEKLNKFRFEDDPDYDKIVETVDKIVNLINKSDKKIQTDLINSEVSDLINMVNS